MPTKAAAFKAVRKTARRTERNRSRKRKVHEVAKSALAAIAQKEADAASKVRAACTAIDKAVQKGTMHHKTADRKKSRLMKRLNAILKA